ncbi:MAG: serine hydrolase [Burkholderiaceae bacterium]|nr:serine hydrolase [Burkholderiaceae bacterium]
MPANARHFSLGLARRAHGILLLLAALCSGAASGQTSPPERLEDTVRLRIDGDRSGVGVQVAHIALDETPRIATADACASARTDRPAPSARFEIGSISKAIVGVLIAEMIERGELAPDATLASLLPAERSAPFAEAVRLIDLLTHTSGLPPLPPAFRPRAGLANPYADVTADVIYGGLSALPPPASTPQPYLYSNWAFMLLSDLAARRAGRPFDALLAERVLAPLAMRETAVARNDGVVRGRSSWGARVPHWDFPVAFAGAGGVRSTLRDMIVFATALLGDVPAEAPETLRRALVASRAPLRAVGERLSMGMGWHLLRRPDGSTFTFHNGMTGGFSAALLLDTERRRAAIVLADAFGGFDDLALHLLDRSAPLAPPRRAVALDLPAARAAAGRYELAPGFVLTVWLEGRRLYAQATGQAAFELLQDSRGDYYTTATELLIRFSRDGDGRAPALTLSQGGGVLQGKRLD